MQNITKSDTPTFFKKIEINKAIKNWKDLDKLLISETEISIKEELRKHILENEQNSRCVYCEVKIISSNSKSHIEHIEPKDKAPNKFKDYRNLVVSCNASKTCGNHKGNNYSSDFINPVLENPEKYLTYDLMTGEIIPRNSDERSMERANYTIELLNLNYSKLKDIRSKFILEAEKMKDFLEYLDEFPSLKNIIKSKY